MGGLEFFLIALVMYGVWRAWMALRGEDGSPEGHWHSRTEAMSEYLERTNPGSTRWNPRKLAGYLMLFVAVVAFEVWLFAWLMPRVER